MSTINISTAESAASKMYWNMLKDLSSDIKLELISRLSASLLEKKESSETSNWVSQLAGRWEDERTAEEIIADIRSSRTSNRDIDL